MSNTLICHSPQNNAPNTNPKSLVYFEDTLEDKPTPHFGILFDNDYILCLCCGEWLEPEDYKIIIKYENMEGLDAVLKEHYGRICNQ